MQIITSINELRAVLSASERPIGLVPTMGFLHDGHLALMQEARKHNKTVVASIFVNPTQFGPNEDFDKYPRDIARDEALLAQAGVDMLFYPSVQEMYPAGATTTIHVAGVSEGFCGASRPVHFDGVALVVTKLFNIVRPQNAYFGLKDYQQFQVIRRFVKDLNIDVSLTGVPIVREADGLALSSRNVYLSADERRSALALSASFELISRLLEEEKPLEEIKQSAIDFIHLHPHTAVEYLEFADPESLQPVHSNLDNGAGFVCLMAVRVGKTRLIDNKLFMNYSKSC